MIQVVLFLLVGLGLFAFLYALIRRSRTAEGSAQQVLKARQALSVLQAGLLPAQVLERIFAKDDYDYVVSAGDAALTRMFVAERKAIALSWVREIRQRIVSLQEFHRGSARLYSRLSLRTEMRLAFDFFILWCACRALEMSLHLRGPYAAPQMVGRVARVAGSVCATSEEAMSFLSTMKIERLAADSGRNLTAL